MDKKLKDLTAFLREHRSNEGNFEKLYQKLQEETTREDADAQYRNELQALVEKEADEYRKAKEAGGTAWPEFEKFASGFEKAVVNATKKEN